MDREYFKQLLRILLQSDRRVQCHSFHLFEGVFQHTDRCPRCQAINIINEKN